ncbi:beta-ketoacyl-[acyl-carrier-protein] synthase family protein [Streptomonospora nanhaiensis]|uniref:hypothetical protein n=1 Tax=Streptomonospora nanhaiensis TaxID=1323731 RepID=UPI001C388C69|nr:hypothetical protein [Streptomonospora nanhaiensis]
MTVRSEARWPPPGSPSEPLPRLPRFEASTFGPLIVAAAERCLGAHYGAPPVPPEAGRRMALVLAATRGDVATQAAIDDAVARRQPVARELLFQNVPSTALGHLSIVWGLTGPLITTLAIGPPEHAADATAARVLASGDADRVLAVAVDPGGAAPGTATARLLAGGR